MDTPKKSLGQHWLTDPATLNQIVAYGVVSPKDTVLEVGPGLGSLTTKLSKVAKKVVAVEFDDNLAGQLKRRLSSKNIEVFNQDILKFDLTELPSGYKVIANIPYYLTSNLLRVLSESTNPPALMVLLVQKEVAQRVCAKPGQMSTLSVSVQLYYDGRLGIGVPAQMFTPPPKVDSQVVILRRRAEPMFPGLDKAIFFQIVRAGFSGRRKKLRSSLAAGLHLSKGEADLLLNQAEINGDLRAQNLSLEQWHRLYLHYHARADLRSLLRS